MPAVITDNANYDASTLLNLQASTSMAGARCAKKRETTNEHHQSLKVYVKATNAKAKQVCETVFFRYKYNTNDLC